MADPKGKGKEEVEQESDKDEEGIPFRKEDLPYGGDRLQAMRAQDRTALRLIAKWIEKYGQVIVARKKEGIRPLPSVAKDCKNEEDYFSNERWDDDNLPNIYIRYIQVKQDGRMDVEGTYCHKYNDIMAVINEPQNQLAAWVRPQANASFDDNGYVVIPGVVMNEQNKYAEASIVEQFVELPVRRTFLKSSLTKNLKPTEQYYFAGPIYKTRVGNLDGSYGSSRAHGQAPDTTIYYLVAGNKFSPTDFYHEIYHLKTNRHLQMYENDSYSLEDINYIQVNFPTAQADINYYWNGKGKDESLVYYPGMTQSQIQPQILPSYSINADPDDDLQVHPPLPLLPPSPSPEEIRDPEYGVDYDEYGPINIPYYSEVISEEFDWNQRTLDLMVQLGLVFTESNRPNQDINDKFYGFMYLYLNDIVIILSSNGRAFIELRKRADMEDMISDPNYVVISDPAQFDIFFSGENPFDNHLNYILGKTANKLDSMGSDSEIFQEANMMLKIDDIFNQGYGIWVDQSDTSKISIRKYLYIEDEEEFAIATEGYRVIQNWDNFLLHEIIYNFYTDTFEPNESVRETISAASISAEIAVHSNQLISNLGLNQFTEECNDTIFPDYYINSPIVYGYFNLYLSDVSIMIKDYQFVGISLDYNEDNTPPNINRLSNPYITSMYMNYGNFSWFEKAPGLKDILCQSANRVVTMDHHLERYKKIKMLLELESMFSLGFYQLVLGQADNDNSVQSGNNTTEIANHSYIYDWSSTLDFGIDKLYERYTNSESLQNLIYRIATGENTRVILIMSGIDQFPKECGLDIFPEYHINEPMVYGYFNLLLSSIVPIVSNPPGSHFLFLNFLDESHLIEEDQVLDLEHLIYELLSDAELKGIKHIKDLNLVGENDPDFSLNDILCQSANQVATLDPNSEKYKKIKMMMQLESILNNEKYGYYSFEFKDGDDYYIKYVNPMSWNMNPGYSSINSNWVSIYNYGIDALYDKYKHNEALRNQLDTFARDKE